MDREDKKPLCDREIHVSGGTWQKVKYSGGKRSEQYAWVSSMGNHVKLESFDVTRVDEPQRIKRLSIACGVEIHGFCSTSFFDGYAIHISSDGENAKVFYCHW